MEFNGFWAVGRGLVKDYRYYERSISMDLEKEVFVKWGEYRYLLFISKRVLSLIRDSDECVCGERLGNNWGYDWGGDTWRKDYRYQGYDDCIDTNYDVKSVRGRIAKILKERAVVEDYNRDVILNKFGNTWYLFIKDSVLEDIGDSDIEVWFERLGFNWGYCGRFLSENKWFRDWMREYRCKARFELPRLAGCISEEDWVNKRVQAALDAITINNKIKESEDVDIKIVATGKVRKDGKEAILVLISSRLLNRIDEAYKEKLCGDALNNSWGYYGSTSIHINTIRELGINPNNYKVLHVLVDSRKVAYEIKEEVKEAVKKALAWKSLKPTII